MENDLISRQAAIDAANRADYRGLTLEDVKKVTDEVVKELKQLPSAQPERKTGTWILVKGSNGKDYHKCSECLHTQEITGVKNYCAVCGAEMRGEQHERFD